MKIGIITIHRIINYGSALQAYALQFYIEKVTKDQVEIIDYIYPNQYHKSKSSFIKRMRTVVRMVLDYLYGGKMQRDQRFKEFRSKYIHLSKKSYKSIQSLYNDPPIYDLYITGSDQVWNVKALKNDPAMYCTFAPEYSKCIAFGASFSIGKLPQSNVLEIKQRLNKYSYIGVRESSSLSILQSLKLNKDINIATTCDPTLLLEAADYTEIAEQSSIKIKGDYILVYYMDYAYNPEPLISEVTRIAVDKFNCKVVVIGDAKKFEYKGHCQYINSHGPFEFVYLIKHAKFIITSSFHGTMFSLIFRKAFTAILPSKDESDCRIKDLLIHIGLGNNGIHNNVKNVIIPLENPYTPDVEQKISDHIKDSKTFLERGLAANRIKTSTNI